MPGICYAYQKGECERGDGCRFSHNEAEADASTSPKPRGVCYAFQKGECDRGEGCRFLHEEGEVPENSAPRERTRKPRTSGGAASSPRTRTAGSRGACYAFAKGECERGDTCRFSHGDDDNEPRAPKPKGACFAFAKGECERGDSCRFSHEAAAN